MNEETRAGEGAWDRLADRLDRIGERLRSHGLRFAYHNHDFELADGEDRLAAMLARAADHLALELDVFWADHAGFDPAAYLRDQGRRVLLVHLKDGRHQPLAHTPLGDGDLELGPAIAAALETGVEALYVEQDTCEGDPFEALRGSAASSTGTSSSRDLAATLTGDRAAGHGRDSPSTSGRSRCRWAPSSRSTAT